MLVESLLFFIVGSIGWTLSEYLIHRFQFHGRGRSGPMTREHTKHHKTAHHFAPTWHKMALALPTLAGLCAVLNTLIPNSGALFFPLGFGLTYCAYELYHRRLHTHAPKGPWGRKQRLHHYHHHFQDPAMNHGVTTPFWDMLFGTYAKVESVQIPQRHLLAWMVDAQTGLIKAEFAKDYRTRKNISVPQPRHAPQALQSA